MRSMTPRVVLTCLLSCFIVLLAPALVARAAAPKEIDESILKAKEYLYSKQKEGNWEKVQQRDPTTKPYSTEGGQWGSVTATVIYGMLAGGEKADDSRLKPAIDFLLSADLVGVTAIGMRANVCNLLPKSPQVKQVMIKDLAFLRKAVKNSGKAKGFYDHLDSGDKVDHYD